MMMFKILFLKEVCEKEGSLVGERHNGQENMAATREIDVTSDSSLGDDEPDEKSSIKVKL